MGCCCIKVCVYRAPSNFLNYKVMFSLLSLLTKVSLEISSLKKTLYTRNLVYFVFRENINNIRISYYKMFSITFSSLHVIWRQIQLPLKNKNHNRVKDSRENWYLNNVSVNNFARFPYFAGVYEICSSLSINCSFNFFTYIWFSVFKQL